MKTTVEIPDNLLREARQYAHENALTFRQVLETGLRQLLSTKDTARAPFRLKDRSFRGDGMVRDFSWPEIRSVIYEGRGE
jgi:hypothetical protein